MRNNVQPGGRRWGGESEGGRERAGETEGVKITFVRLPSNMFHGAQGWFNPVFPAADPQPASHIPLSHLSPLPSENEGTEVKGSTQSCTPLNWGHQRGWNRCKKKRAFLEKKLFFFKWCVSARRRTYVKHWFSS